MQKYPVRPSHRKNLDPAVLVSLARTHFETAEESSGTITARWGAIQRLSVRGDGRELAVDLTMNPKVDESVAAETIARYNKFLEATTGFGAKERARRLRKSARAASGEE
ncbi:MAG: DUF5611 family protein [Thermoplasmata archaeon]